MTATPVPGTPGHDPIALVNQLSALAADARPACEHCDAEVELVETSAGVFIHRTLHDRGCPEMADGRHITKRHFSIEELDKVQRQREGDQS